MINQQHTAEWSFDAIGTKWQIMFFQPVAASLQARLKRQVRRRIADFDKAYSRFRADSLVSAIAKAAGAYTFPSDARQLFDFYQQLYVLTGGKVTPLVGKVLSDLGYDADYSLQPGAAQPAPDWNKVMQFSGTTLETYQPVLLDFGAAGKGYLVDILVDMLAEAGMHDFYINAGGDIRCYELRRPLRVGLEHPSDTSQIIGVMELSHGALCGSAGNRRAWAGYTHILDPFSLTSPRHIAATWCVADSALMADGLATALYFTDYASLHAAYDFVYCSMYADLHLEYSQLFEQAVFKTAEVANV